MEVSNSTEIVSTMSKETLENQSRVYKEELIVIL